MKSMNKFVFIVYVVWLGCVICRGISGIKGWLDKNNDIPNFNNNQYNKHQIALIKIALIKMNHG